MKEEQISCTTYADHTEYTYARYDENGNFVEYFSTDSRTLASPEESPDGE